MHGDDIAGVCRLAVPARCLRGIFGRAAACLIDNREICHRRLVAPFGCLEEPFRGVRLAAHNTRAIFCHQRIIRHRWNVTRLRRLEIEARSLALILLEKDAQIKQARETC